MREPAEAPRRRIKELEVMVADVVVETPDTVTLVLFTGNDRLEYKPGHFCTIDPHQFELLRGFTAYLEDAKGKKELPRAYSLASAPHERYVAITIKEEPFVKGTTRYPPLLSPFLVREVKAGRRMAIIGFTGPYTLPDDIESRTDHLVHLVAGSGSVPNFSMLKHALHTGMRLRHTFIYSNKTYADIAFKQELDRLERAFPEKLTVVHALTRESDPARLVGNIRRGRVTTELLRELVPDPDTAWVYACGPAISPYERAAAKEKGVTPQPRFLETMISQLNEIGIPGVRIKRESYG